MRVRYRNASQDLKWNYISFDIPNNKSVQKILRQKFQGKVVLVALATERNWL